MLSMREAVYRQGNPDSYIMESFSGSASEVHYRTVSCAVWDDDSAEDVGE